MLLYKCFFTHFFLIFFLHFLYLIQCRAIWGGGWYVCNLFILYFVKCVLKIIHFFYLFVITIETLIKNWHKNSIFNYLFW